MASSCFQSANSNCSIGATIWMPALLTRMSMPPKAETTFAMPASTWSSFVTSMAISLDSVAE